MIMCMIQGRWPCRVITVTRKAGYIDLVASSIDVRTLDTLRCAAHETDI